MDIRRQHPVPAAAWLALFLVTGWLAPSPARAQDDDAEEEPDQEILVTAPRIPAKDPSSDTQPIEGEQLRESPRASLLESVSQEAPWVYVSSRGVGLHGVAGGSSGGISIRGLGGSPNTQVLVLLDGVPDYQGLFGHPLPDAYVPELVDQVQVTAGGDSVLYGTNAMGGVIALKSRWRTQPGTEFHLRSGAGSFGTLMAGPTMLAHWGDWDVAAAFHGRVSDGHRPGAGGELEVAQAGGRVWLGEHARLTLWTRVARMKGADPGPDTHPHPDNWFEALRLNASAGLERFGETSSLRATAWVSGGRHLLYDGYSGLDLVAGVTLENRLRIRSNLNLLLGAAFDHTDGSVENRISGERQPVEGLTNFSVYQQVTWNPLGLLTLVAGTREVESLQFGFQFLYKGGVQIALWKGGFLRAHYVTNFRQPTIRERYLPYPVANPDLQPEYSQNLDAGLAQQIGERFHAEVNLFRTEAFNLIKYFGSWPSATVINIDHVVFPGVEGLVRLENLGPFHLTLGGAWLDVGRYTKQNPSLKLNARLGFRHRALKLALSGEWVSGLYQNNYSRDPLDDVFFVDLDARYRLGDGGLVLFLIARNLTNNRYAYIDSYPMPGFNLFGGLEVHL